MGAFEVGDGLLAKHVVSCAWCHRLETANRANLQPGVETTLKAPAMLREQCSDFEKAKHMALSRSGNVPQLKVREPLNIMS